MLNSKLGCVVGRWLYTAPCGMRAKWPSERRAPVYWNKIGYFSGLHEIQGEIQPDTSFWRTRACSDQWNIFQFLQNSRYLPPIWKPISTHFQFTSGHFLASHGLLVWFFWSLTRLRNWQLVRQKIERRKTVLYAQNRNTYRNIEYYWTPDIT